MRRIVLALVGVGAFVGAIAATAPVSGQSDGEAPHAKCFPCHAPAKDHDFVFTRYAPTP